MDSEEKVCVNEMRGEMEASRGPTAETDVRRDRQRADV